MGNKSYVNATGKLALNVVFIQSLVSPCRVTLKMIFDSMKNNRAVKTCEQTLLGRQVIQFENFIVMHFRNDLDEGFTHDRYRPYFSDILK